jgi:glycosyltransferase involved in cell wall biosynthesis
MPGLAGRRILVHVGRIAPEKNPDLLLQAVRLVVARAPEALLLFVGDGPYRRALECSVARQGLAPWVRFTGYLERRQVAYVLSIADAFVFASKTDTFPLAIIEAMLCGAPVVAVNARGTDEIIVDARYGDLVPEDAAAFADRVLALLADEPLRRRRAAEAQQAAQSLTLDRMVDRTAELYERLVAHRRSPKRVPCLS